MNILVSFYVRDCRSISIIFIHGYQWCGLGKPANATWSESYVWNCIQSWWILVHFYSTKFLYLFMMFAKWFLCSDCASSSVTWRRIETRATTEELEPRLFQTIDLLSIYFAQLIPHFWGGRGRGTWKILKLMTFILFFLHIKYFSEKCFFPPFRGKGTLESTTTFL